MLWYFFYAAGLFESDTHTPPWGGHACTFLWREKRETRMEETRGDGGNIDREVVILKIKAKNKSKSKNKSPYLQRGQRFRHQ